MKAIEKKKMQELILKLNAEVERAEKDTDILSDEVYKSNYDKEIYNKYQQSYHYLNGTMMMRTIVASELRKLGIERAKNWLDIKDMLL